MRFEIVATTAAGSMMVFPSYLTRGAAERAAAHLATGFPSWKFRVRPIGASK